jgi:hypothetical protein
MMLKDSDRVGSICTKNQIHVYDSASKSTSKEFIVRLCGEKHFADSHECEQMVNSMRRGVKHKRDNYNWKSPAKYFNDILDSL